MSDLRSPQKVFGRSAYVAGIFCVVSKLLEVGVRLPHDIEKEPLLNHVVIALSFNGREEVVSNFPMQFRAKGERLFAGNV